MSLVTTQKLFSSFSLTEQFLQQVALKDNDASHIKIAKVASIVFLTPLVFVGDLIYKSYCLIRGPVETLPPVPSHSWRSRGITLTKFAGLVLIVAIISKVVAERYQGSFISDIPPIKIPERDEAYYRDQVMSRVKTEVTTKGICPIMEPFQHWKVAELLKRKVTEGVLMDDVLQTIDRSGEAKIDYPSGPDQQNLPKEFSYNVIEYFSCERNTYLPVLTNSGRQTKVYEILTKTSKFFGIGFSDPIFSNLKAHFQSRSDDNQGFEFTKYSGGSHEVIPRINLLCHQTTSALSCEGKIDHPRSLSGIVWHYSVKETKDKIVESLCQLAPQRKVPCHESDHPSIPGLLSKIISNQIII